MKRNQSTMRQFGQLSLPSSFLSNSSSKDCKEDVQNKPSKTCISLSDFLDRKLNKTTQKSIQEKQKPFSSIASGSAGEHIELRKSESDADFLLNGALFQQVKRTSKQEDCHGSSGGDEAEEFQLEYTINGEDSKKRKTPFAVSEDERHTAPRYLVILGDDPKPKQKGTAQRSMNKRPKHLFNHYANGSGLWDCNMEGVDSEEVGCSEVWEGMGSTTLGALEWH
ncbi:RNA-binding protein isoform X2 [Tasmannia lanceolata]|uniref:RNA-binding protein isoform X2 n=1 Tax=Tasmannia lanceolata TaxID=3420 RepID=UPI00406379B6